MKLKMQNGLTTSCMVNMARPVMIVLAASFIVTLTSIGVVGDIFNVVANADFDTPDTGGFILNPPISTAIWYSRMHDADVTRSRSDHDCAACVEFIYVCMQEVCWVLWYQWWHVRRAEFDHCSDNETNVH
jgi:hypothetical protein